MGIAQGAWRKACSGSQRRLRWDTFKAKQLSSYVCTTINEPFYETGMGDGRARRFKVFFSCEDGCEKKQNNAKYYDKRHIKYVERPVNWSAPIVKGPNSDQCDTKPIKENSHKMLLLFLWNSVFHNLRNIYSLFRRMLLRALARISPALA